MQARFWIPAAILLLCGAAIFLPALGQELSVSGGEAIHAEIARGMAVTGDYLVPRLCGRPYIDKPPLFNWCAALLFRLTGRVDFTLARLPSAICSIAVVIGICLLGQRWFSTRAGTYAALICATSWLAVEWGRFCQMDMMQTSLILYAVLLADVAAAQERSGRRTAAWLAACALVGAAVMAKNPTALFYFLVAVACLWRARRRRWLPPLRLLLLAAAVVVAISLAWPLAVEIQDPGHMRRLLGYQFGEGLTEHAARITLYFDQLLLRTAPWGIFSVGAAWWAIRHVKHRGYDLAAAPALFMLVSLAIMTLTPNKREHYLLPLLPIWSLFIGGFLDRMFLLRQTGPGQGYSEEVPRWMFEWPIRLALAAAILLAAGLAVYWVRSTRELLAAGMAMCAAMALLGACGLLAAARAHNEKALAILLAICVLAMAAMYPLTLKALNPPMKDRVAARQVAQSIPAGAPVADFDVRNPYLTFKLNRPVTLTNDLGELMAFLREPGRRYLLSSTASLESLTAISPRPFRQVEKCYIPPYFVTVWEAG